MFPEATERPLPLPFLRPAPGLTPPRAFLGCDGSGSGADDGKPELLPLGLEGTNGGCKPSEVGGSLGSGIDPVCAIRLGQLQDRSVAKPRDRVHFASKPNFHWCIHGRNHARRFDFCQKLKSNEPNKRID